MRCCGTCFRVGRCEAIKPRGREEGGLEFKLQLVLSRRCGYMIFGSCISDTGVQAHHPTNQPSPTHQLMHTSVYSTVVPLYCTVMFRTCSPTS